MRYLFALLLAVAAGAVPAQQLYRWTDKDGKVQYGEKPPAGVAAKAVKGQSNAVAPPPAQPSQPGRPVDRTKSPGYIPPPDPKKQY